MQHLGSDVHEKGHKANGNADDVDNVVPVSKHLTIATAVHTKLLVWLHRARKGFGYQIALEHG